MDNAGKKPVWSVQPPKGMLKGDYYRIEERFPPYYPGVEGALYLPILLCNISSTIIPLPVV